MTLTIGSMFSGTGGLDMAVEAVTGATPAWFCEWDEAPSKILNHHWPQVPNLRDVTQVDWSQVEPVDIITGGSPCQDLSQAGKRAGMTEGTRSNLWVNMREAIAIIKPRLVVWENVRGALSATATSDSDLEHGTGLLGNPTTGHLRAFGRVLGDLTDLGYDARWTTIRASDIGAPHHRARIFLIATPADTQGSRGIPINDSPWCPPACREGNGRTDGGYRSEVATDTSSIRPQTGHIGTCGHGPQVSRVNSGGETLSHASSIRCEWARASRTGWAGFTDCHNRDVEWGEYAPAIRRWERIVGPAPAPTEPNSKGNPRLNAAFVEYLMGLPAGHVTAPEIGLTRAQQLKALGNGVVPQQAEAALRSMLTTPEMLGAP